MFGVGERDLLVALDALEEVRVGLGVLVGQLVGLDVSAVEFGVGLDSGLAGLDFVKFLEPQSLGDGLVLLGEGLVPVFTV